MLPRVLAQATADMEPTAGSGSYRYEARVEVTAARPSAAPAGPVREGVIRVLVFRPDGDFANGLTAADFSLNLGRVDVVSARENVMQPAVLVVVDRTSWSVSSESDPAGARSPRSMTEARTFVGMLAREFPGGYTALAFLGAGPTEDVVPTDGAGTGGWLPNATLDPLLSGPLRRFFDRPAARVAAGTPKHLLRNLAEESGRFVDHMVADCEPFLVVLTDGFEGTPQAGYRVIPTIIGPALWPLPTRREAEVTFERMLAAQRVHPILVLLPRRGIRGDHVVPATSVWAGAAALDATRLGLRCRALDGVSIDAESATDRAALRQVAAAIRERTRSYWIAWRAPAATMASVSFLRIDLPGHADLRCVPARIGEQLLLSADPYVAPWVGSLDNLPAEVGRRLGVRADGIPLP